MPPLRVLLVEDNRLLRWWMSSGLSSAGFDITAPQAVMDALEEACTCAYDIVITDWRLGDGLSGMDVLKRVRQKCPHTLTVLISAEADGELADQARSAGFDVVILKPFAVAEIVSAVRELAMRQPAHATT